MAGNSVGWTRWRQICGWLALAAATLWALKFTFIVATPDYASDAQVPPMLEFLNRWFVQFAAPTVGSLLAIVAFSGLAEPLVRRMRWFFGVPIAIASALLGTIALSVIINATAAWAVDAGLISAAVEPEVIIEAALLLVISTVLLRPVPHGRLLGTVLAVGGLLWIIQPIMIATGTPLQGWAIAAYQFGLYLLAVGASWLLAHALRSRRYRAAALGAAMVFVAYAAGAIPLLAGGLGLFLVGGLALAASVPRLSRGSLSTPLPST